MIAVRLEELSLNFLRETDALEDLGENRQSPDRGMNRRYLEYVAWVRSVRVGKNLSDMFPIRNGLKQGDAVSPLLFNFSLEYAIRRVQVNQDDLKLNGTHQLLAYADDVNTLGGSIHTIKENAEALEVATKEIGLEVNAD